MIKGFIHFNKQKIPFVINEYYMELFSDNSILKNFMKNYNFKKYYILSGEYFNFGLQSQKIDILVDHSIGSKCYLCCYIIYKIGNSEYDTIRVQSTYLDDIFRYKYNYINTARNGTNLSTNPMDFYEIPFLMNNNKYTLKYRIGYNTSIGLLEDLNKKGEIIISMHTNKIKECLDITNTLYRLAMFMTSNSNVPFKQITLYKEKLKVGDFFCPLISNKNISSYDFLFYEFNVMKYIPKILNNVASDCKNKITKSVPLGHLSDLNSLYTPQRFIEQIIAFEYLFNKLEYEKAQNKNFSLKKELTYMLNKFPDLLKSKSSPDTISQQIKKLRVDITHGYKYYYDFQNDLNICYLIDILDQLIKKMSLLYIGFSKEEIKNFPIIG